MRWWGLLLVACTGGPSEPTFVDTYAQDTDAFWVGPDGNAPAGVCGNGVVEGEEACDNGADNSDSTPDACRTDCTLPRCGDGVEDGPEACDDGNLVYGDGCSPGCVVESGPYEVEPNDDAASAQAYPQGASLIAELTEGDEDCYAVDVPADGYVDATASGTDGLCPPNLVLRLLDGEGREQVRASSEDACVHLNANVESDAAFLEEGRYVVCVEGEASSYLLTVTVGADSCVLEIPPPDPADFDGDGVADQCDPDDDGDGVEDAVDNCPRTSNGPETALVTDAEGFVRHWLLSGPWVGVSSENRCLPTVERLPGGDGAHVPSLGLDVQGKVWFAEFQASSEIDFRDVFGDPPTPRESFAVSWVYSASSRRVVVHVGADDGSRVWVNGVQIGEDSGCHGVRTDQFRWEADLRGGWNKITLKVYDQGGGWGQVLRLRDVEDDTPLAGLPVSLADGVTWRDEQSDQDGDGVGDVCDREPTVAP